jgi:hypothetical protein
MTIRTVDTRKKIQTWEELRPALADGKWKILAGSFDPLTADAAARIESSAEEGRRLLIVVQPISHALFDDASRALLLAALRAVDAVTIETSDEWRTVAAENPAVDISDEARLSIQMQSEFEQLVLSRQRVRSEK